MDVSQMLALKQSYQDMIDLLEKCIQEGSAKGLSMGIPKSVDRYANPDSDKLLGMVGPTDYSRYLPSISIVINNSKSHDESLEDPAEESTETPEFEAEEDYVV